MRIPRAASGPLPWEKYNARLFSNINRNNQECATSRAFRELARRTADTVRLSPYTARRSDLHPKHFPLIHSYQTCLTQKLDGKPPLTNGTTYVTVMLA